MPARVNKIRHDENTRDKWYVYALCDPRDNSIFYIGKGCGKRVDAHEAEAKRNSAGPKARQIRAIWAAGLEVEKRILERFEEEAAAFRLERRLIRDLKPRANIAHGTTKIVTLLGLIFEMMRTWRDLRPQMVRCFPREVVAQYYPPEFMKLYDAILVSPRFSTLESASG